MRPVFNSLRYRFFFVMGVVLLIAVMLLALIARQLVIPALLAEEEKYATAELDRAVRAINGEMNHLSLLNKDWAIWDDSYAFIQNGSRDYLESNIADGLVFEDADLSLMIFLRADGTPHWIGGIHPQNERYTACVGLTSDCAWAMPVLESLQQRIADDLDDETRTWLQARPQQAMVSVWSIVKSNGDGPIAGWLLMMRPMNEEWFAKLENRAGLVLSIEPNGSAASQPRQRIERQGSQSMTAIRRMTAEPEGASLELNAELPRHNFRTGIDDFRLILYWIVGLLVVVVVLLLLERMILSPLRRLATFAQEVQQDDDIDPPQPLLQRRDEIGVLARRFQQLLEHQRSQTSSLIELSQRDPLTGLANRRLFDKRLEESMSIANLNDQPLALLMVDIDYFKAYNDHYGHPAGDECLRAIADAMRKHFNRPQQLVARTGGEEFMVILPDISLEASVQQAETLRRAIEHLALPHAASSVSSVVTISVGIALHAPARPHGIEELTRAVDRALYAAKQSGRNRISLGGAHALS
ncbi:diguanylate cyclase domain-containing protein [Halomonas sp. M20]|uniref:sensor domain-containing diguanylate cyclase n=1 Tax=Halomonas sp. M20 TaxID=2763264 RepID=UPI001D0B02FE|nr:diguanylate cyclase [Halomonas sp. M20]